MKITFIMSGGFAYLPALSKPVMTDTTKLEPQMAKELESLVWESHFFDLPALPNIPPKGAADHQTYTITVEDGSNTHTVQVTDPITDANLGRLVARFQVMARPTIP
jgi:hypothetical protein